LELNHTNELSNDWLRRGWQYGARFALVSVKKKKTPGSIGNLGYQISILPGLQRCAMMSEGGCF